MSTDAAQSAFKQTIIDLLFNLNHVTFSIVKVSSSLSPTSVSASVSTSKRMLRGQMVASSNLVTKSAVAPLPIVSLVYVIQFGYTTSSPYALYTQATSLLTSSVNSGTFTSLLTINGNIYHSPGLSGSKANIPPGYTPLALTSPYSYPTFSPSISPTSAMLPTAAPQTKSESNSANSFGITATIIVLATVAGAIILILVYFLIRFDRRRRQDINRWNDALKDVSIPMYEDSVAKDVYMSSSTVVPVAPTSAPAWLERDTTEPEPSAWMSDGYTDRNWTRQPSPGRVGTHGGERVFESYFRNRQQEDENDHDFDNSIDDEEPDYGMSDKGNSRFTFFPQLGDIYQSMSQKATTGLRKSTDGVSGKREPSTLSSMMRSLSQSSLFASRPGATKQVNKTEPADIEARGNSKPDSTSTGAKNEAPKTIPFRLTNLSILNDSSNQKKGQLSPINSECFSLESSYPAASPASPASVGDGSFLRESPLARRNYRSESMDDDNKNYVLRFSPASRPKVAVDAKSGSSSVQARDDTNVTNKSGHNSRRSSHSSVSLSRTGSAASLTALDALTHTNNRTATQTQSGIVSSVSLSRTGSAASLTAVDALTLTGHSAAPTLSPTLPIRNTTRMMSLNVPPNDSFYLTANSRRNSQSVHSAQSSLRTTPSNPHPVSLTRSSIVSLQSADDNFLDSVDVTMQTRDLQLQRLFRSSIDVLSERGSITRDSIYSTAHSEMPPSVSPNNRNAIQYLEDDEDSIL